MSERNSGNRFRLLENSQGYLPRLFEVIDRAREEVLLEMFIPDQPFNAGLRGSLDRLLAESCRELTPKKAPIRPLRAAVGASRQKG